MLFRAPIHAQDVLRCVPNAGETSNDLLNPGQRITIPFRQQSVIKWHTMLQQRFQLSGLFAMLLALMAQLGAAANQPQIDVAAANVVLCHSDDGNPPAQAPPHPTDCPMCSLCIGSHVQAPVLAAEPRLPPAPRLLPARRPELPPPATAPPLPHRPPNQPRAPPAIS